MASQKGICKNYVNCDRADKELVTEIAFGEDFICPECKKELFALEVDRPGPGRGFDGPVKKRPWLAWCMGGGILLALWFIGAALVNWWQGDPRIQLSATAVAFEFQQIGRGEGSREIEIRNVGQSGTLDVSLQSSSPDFSTRKKSFAIKPGQSAKLEILFKPSSPGPQEAALTLVSDDSTQPEVAVQLTGTAGKLGPWWIWEQWEQATQSLDK